jgi:hypothetical protein
MPTKTIRILVGAGHSSESLLKALMKNSCGELEEYLTADLEHLDSRVTYNPGTFDLRQVNEGDDATYVLEYTFDWEAYYRFRDINMYDI